VNLALPRPVLFWIFILVAGTGEAAFAYNDFTGGWLRWVLSGLIIVNICLLALLDRTPPVRKAITYIAAALVWGGLRYGYRWVYNALGDGNLSVAHVLFWFDQVFNAVLLVILLVALRSEPRAAGGSNTDQ
jgi:hypothetical protein